MSSNKLKFIAILTMVIDHIGYVLFPEIIMIRIIGRLAFPIFTFLIAEGYLHTKNVNQYMVRLGVFAIISEIPFDFAFHGKILEFHSQNIFFTLFLGLLAIKTYHYFKEKSKILSIGSLILMCMISFVLKTDYYVFGVLMIFFFDRLRHRYALKMLVEAVLLCGLTIIIGLSKADFSLAGTYQIFSLASLALIHFYKGEFGRRIPGLKLALYIFYPMHLIVIRFIGSI